jgi:hypothetical protein
MVCGHHTRARHPPLRAAAARFLFAPGASDQCNPLRLTAAKPAGGAAPRATPGGGMAAMRAFLATCQPLLGMPGALRRCLRPRRK